MDNSGRENEPEMFDMIRGAGEGGVPGGEEQEEPNTNVDVSDFLNLTGDGMEPEESDGREPEESVDCDDDDNVRQVYILINPHSLSLSLSIYICGLIDLLCIYIYVH